MDFLRQQKSFYGKNLLLSFALGAWAAWMQGCAMAPVMTTEREQALGAEQAQLVEQAMGLVEDPELVGYVKAIGRRLAANSPRQDIEYTFNVVNMVEPNAFALPGGHLYVSRGLLALVNSEDELAGVMAHEIAHVAAKHHLREAAATAVTSPFRIVTGVAGLATGMVLPRIGQTIAGVGQAASGLIVASYSREQEREADRIGQEILVNAGWNPVGLSRFLKTLERHEALQPQTEEGQKSYFSTHPPLAERVEKTADKATKLTPTTARPIAKNRADLLARLEGLLVGDDPEEGVFIGTSFLQPALDFSMQFPNKWKGMNTRFYVVAQPPEEDATILVMLAGEGNDPLAVARAVEEKLEINLLENAQAVRIGRFRAVWTRVGVRTSEGDIGLDLTWIAHRGLVYQIMGMSPMESFKDYAESLKGIAWSFRPLSKAERAKIKEARLRVARARGGETLKGLINRLNAAWTPAEAAIANATEQNARLKKDQLIKVPILEPYKGRK